MAVPAKRAKVAVIYHADSGAQYVVKHVQDVVDAGGFATGTGAPHPGKGSLVPRHIGLVSTDGTRRFKVPIASKLGMELYTLGQSFTYGGVSCKITSMCGEKVIAR